MGLFDVWESFTDFVGDWWDAFKRKIGDIKNELWDWVDGIAKYWVQRANEFFDILNHTWSEVEDLMEEAKTYADNIVTDAVLKIDNWVSTFGETVAELWDKIEPYFEPIITPIENALDNIQNVRLPTLEDFKSWAKTQLDNILNTDIPFLNQSVKDLWGEAEKIWNKIWEIPDDVWKAITGGWDALTNFILSQGEKLIEKILDVDIPVDDIIEELERKIKGGGK